MQPAGAIWRVPSDVRACCHDTVAACTPRTVLVFTNYTTHGQILWCSSSSRCMHTACCMLTRMPTSADLFTHTGPAGPLHYTFAIACHECIVATAPTWSWEALHSCSDITCSIMDAAAHVVYLISDTVFACSAMFGSLILL